MIVEAWFHKVTPQGLESENEFEASILRSRKFRDIFERYISHDLRLGDLGGGNVRVGLSEKRQTEEAAHLLRDFMEEKIDLEP